MKRTLNQSVLFVSLLLAPIALASEAQTSATAGSNGGRNGTAAATASYEGDVGFARTQSESGRVNHSRAVAVGVDEDGLSLSVSRAIAPRFGPALATNFNLSIGSDGEVSVSRGVAVADGPLERSATAGGTTAARRGPDHATSLATGTTDRFGRVQVHTQAENRPGRVVVVRPVEPRGPVTVVQRGPVGPTRVIRLRP